MAITNKLSRNICTEKVFAERLNCYSALLRFIDLIGAYAITGQTIPGLL